VEPDIPVFVLGPCSLESREVAFAVAGHLRDLFDSLDTPASLVFKGSWLKDNRSSAGSWTGPGLEEGLRILEEVSGTFGMPVLTDVHQPSQVAPVSGVVDVIQIPAFLCRQTSLLEAAGAAGIPVNVKKGQFMDPAGMSGAVEKLRMAGCGEVWLTERGTFFGYGDLVVDMRSLSVMSPLADRVILDVTHSLQKPGSLGTCSGGCPEFALQLARAGAAWGVDGLFVETHPAPADALSDSASMVDLPAVSAMVRAALRHWEGASR
jgi:2-dehydro-3-deoxyphosphooctonate aldolase (KDO 8-P synthase)